MGVNDYFIGNQYIQPQWIATAATTTIYPNQIVCQGGVGYAVSPISSPPAKNDDMSWLRGQVSEIQELAYAV